MTEYELDRLCGQHPECDGKCIKCSLFAKYIDSNKKINHYLTKNKLL